MPRVICELPNAGEEISGVKFHLLDDGRRLSDEIADEAAARFCSIPGYVLDEEEREEEPAAPPAPKLTKAQQKALEKKQAEEAAAKAEAEPEAEQKVDESKPGTDEQVF
jgi:hypothetical protein